MIQYRILSLLVASILASVLAAAEQPPRPNILIIFTDDQGWGDLGCYGSQTNKTPRMDQFAREGTRFTSFYSQSVCGPARSALLTGRYPIRSKGWSMPASEITFAELIREAGYQTACIGKWDVSNRKAIIERMPNAQGFDYYFGPLGANDNGLVTFHENNDAAGETRDMGSLLKMYTDKSIDWLKNKRDPNRPFVLYLAHTMMHTIIDASPRFRGTTRGDLYGDVVAEFDYETGRLLDVVDDLGLRDNTLVIYTSDNGPWNQEAYTSKKKGHPEGSIFWGDSGPLRAGKGSVYEAGSRVPCIVRWPGKVPSGRVSDAIFATIDFLPTFANLTGYAVPGDRVIDGIDQTNLLLGKTDTGRETFVYDQINTPSLAMRWKNWKLLVPGRQGDKTQRYLMDFGTNDYELYDLGSDIGETRNLINDQPEITRNLKNLLQKHVDSTKGEVMPQVITLPDKEKAPGASASVIPPKGNNASPVPRYQFAKTLQQQEKQLANNPLLERFRISRKEILKDPLHPRYHFTSPENRLNDPNGLSYWNGNWHLFYQGYPPEHPRQHWGHAVSTDLIHWRDLPYAIYPGPEQACFSGSALVEEDRVIAMYHGTEVGTMVAVSSDPLLLNWNKVTGKAVIPESVAGPPPLPNRIFDPCIWKDGDYYYALTAGQTADGPGGKSVRAEYLHRSKDLAVWEYMHQFLEDDRFGIIGDDGACPYFWPIGDRHMLIHYSHTSGGKWLLGDLDRERMKFVVTDGGDFNHGPSAPGGVHAPSACPDGEGGILVIFNMNPGFPSKGWNQLMSLPRRITLAPDDPWDPIRQVPAGDYASLRGAKASVTDMVLPANQDVVLKNISGNTMELIAEIDPGSAQAIELELLRSPGGEEKTRLIIQTERGYGPRTFGLEDMQKRRSAKEVMFDTVVTLDNTRSSILPQARSRIPEAASFRRGKDEPIRLHIFIDRSVVEVFVNDKACVAARVYPGRADSLGISLRAQGAAARLRSLDAWQMKSIYE